jgi:hypothetical protein
MIAAMVDTPLVIRIKMGVFAQLDEKGVKLVAGFEGGSFH